MSSTKNHDDNCSFIKKKKKINQVMTGNVTTVVANVFWRVGGCLGLSDDW